MVQKSGHHQVRLVVEIPLFTRIYTSQVVGLGISEPPTDSRTLYQLKDGF